jgi:hypothetical protein
MSKVKLSQETPQEAARYALNIYEANRRYGIRTSGDMFMYALTSAGYQIVKKDGNE